MRLMELFSQAQDADPRLSSDINYLDDLKFYMDNNNDVVSNVLFPAIKNHKNKPDDETAYRHYVGPVRKCAEQYAIEYELDDIKDKIFTDENIIQLAKRMAEEQLKHIKNKDYEG